MTDDGPGIPAADRERVFERFTRLDDARGRDAGGAGLGLAIVRELVRRHGGTVTLVDGDPGVRAQVRLPTVPAPAGTVIDMTDETREGRFARGAVSAPAVPPTRARLRTRTELRAQRRPSRHRCWNHLIAAPLWPKYGVNLGTLLRTCNAVGACLAVPCLPWIPQALARGDTLPDGGCVHRVRRPVDWLARQRAGGTVLVGADLADESVRLGDLPAARRRTILVTTLLTLTT